MTLLALSLATALAGDVHLHVGVLRSAGDLGSIVADGAAGQCVAGPATLSCPARGPVTFRWMGDPAYAWFGPDTASPGETLIAFVLATDATVSTPLVALASGATVDLVRDVFVGGGGDEPPPLSPGTLSALLRLTEHPDPLVRRATIDGLVPYWRRTVSDPLVAAAPDLIPADVLSRLATDVDPRVRRALASRLRDVRAPGAVAEATARMVAFEGDRPGIERAALSSLSVAVRDGRVPAEDAWERALRSVSRPGPPGRAAASTLAWCADRLQPGPSVDPTDALDRILLAHPERGWTFWSEWRAHLPWSEAAALRLLRDTVGMNASLIRHWAAYQGDALALAMAKWEPSAPHSTRWTEVVAIVEDAADRLSDGSGPANAP